MGSISATGFGSASLPPTATVVEETPSYTASKPIAPSPARSGGKALRLGKAKDDDQFFMQLKSEGTFKLFWAQGSHCSSVIVLTLTVLLKLLFGTVSVKFFVAA